jgi:hypothetical protein
MPHPSVSPANDRGAMGEGRNLVAAGIPRCVARLPGQDAAAGSRA